MNILDYVGILLMSFVGNVLGVFFWMWMEKGDHYDSNGDNQDDTPSK